MPRVARGQAGLEYILILAILLGALIPVFMYAADTSELSIRTTQSREAVQRIAAAADRLYAMGGGKMEVDVYLPSGIEAFSLGNGTVKLTLRIGEGTGDAFELTRGNLTGVLPVTEGYKKITLVMLPNGTVCMGETCGSFEALVVSIASPLNASYYVTDVLSSVSLNKDGSWCGVSLDSAANQTMAENGLTWSLGLSSLAEAMHNVIFSCSDSAGAVARVGPRYFTIVILPVVTLNYPNNGNVSAFKRIPLNCSATDNEGVTMIELWGNFTGTWSLSESCPVAGPSTSCEWKKVLRNAAYIWNCNATDTKGNNDWGDSNWTFTMNYPVLPNTGALVVYQEGSPVYRNWTRATSTLDSQGATLGPSSNRYWNVLVSSPLTREKLLASATVENTITAQLWDGHGWGSFVTLASSVGGDDRRKMGAAYEQLSGDGMAVYRVDTTQNPRYRIWDGASWGSEATITFSQCSGSINWVRLEPKPASDELMLVAGFSTSQICAKVWNGDSWGSDTLLESSTESTQHQTFDVAYEQQTGRALVVWSNSASDKPRYRIWNGASWGTQGQLGSVGSSDIYWIKLASNPQSNKVVAATIDGGRDLNVQLWDGSAWGTNSELETGLQTYTTRCMDVMFENSSGRALIAYGEYNAQTPRYRTWSGGWSSELSAGSVGANINWVTLGADTKSNDMLMLTLDSDNDVSFQRWNSATAAWAGYQEVNANSDSTYEGTAISFDRH